jgi:membrane-associated phospholipid phosphatase
MTLAQKLWYGAAAALVAIVSAVACLDVPLALLLHSYRETPWANFFAAITDFANGGIWYSLAVLAIILAWARTKFGALDRAGFLRHARAWGFMIVAMATSGILANVLKAVIGRERPRLLFRDGTHDFHPFTLNVDDSSFPSGHTQSIFSAMLALSFLFPPLRPVFLVVATMIAASRVIIGAHYFSDVIGGAYLGIAAVLLWRAWFLRKDWQVTLWLKAPPSGP